MRLMKWVICAVSAVPLCSCAALVTAWKNDPLQSYKVEGPSVYAMTGDRRTAVFIEGPDGRNRFCAESLPDAVAAFSATSKAAAALDIATQGNGKASFDEGAVAGLLQTYQRTEATELYRQMGWNACIAWAQGGIDSNQYYGLLKTMVEGGMSAIAIRASQPISAAPLHSGFIVDPGKLSAADSAGAADKKDDIKRLVNPAPDEAEKNPG